MFCGIQVDPLVSVDFTRVTVESQKCQPKRTCANYIILLGGSTTQLKRRKERVRVKKHMFETITEKKHALLLGCPWK